MVWRKRATLGDYLAAVGIMVLLGLGVAFLAGLLLLFSM